MKKGILIKNKRTEIIAQIISDPINKRDIDPECPESIAIISGHRIQYISGDQLGQSRFVPYRTLNRSWERIKEHAHD